MQGQHAGIVMNMKSLVRVALLALGIISSTQLQADAQSLYEQALDSIAASQYPQALRQLRRLQRDYPSFKNIAAAQTRMAVLQESADAGESLPVFLNALTLRDEGQLDDALAALAVIAEADPAGALTDDALYITAYLDVMERYDFAAARLALQSLNERFPASAYTDSAQYLDAIAMEQLGDTEGAQQSLTELRDRHTALSLPFDFRWPVGTVLSRYWFDRADRRLAIVAERLNSASQVEEQSVIDEQDGSLRLSVSVDGIDMQLLLVPSPLTRSTQWLDAGLSDQLPPSVGVFDGTVEGVDNSWVRAVLQEGSLTGVVNIDGRQTRLTPDNLMGTLDYYQPLSRRAVSASGVHSDLAESLQGLDTLIAPPAPVDNTPSARSVTQESDMRTVSVSIVVDSQYDRYYAGAGLVNAVNNLNIADGIYRQFGLALTLDEALNFTEDDDPLELGAVTLEEILRAFRTYRQQYDTLFADSALSYLFTGNPKTDVTLGLAWIDTMCRIDGYDVGVTTPSSFGDVLLIHEMGHSFGAKHDSDTECSDDDSAVMWPTISADTSTTFTSCSQEPILASHSASCLLNSVDLVLAAAATGTTVNFSLSNPDSSLTLSADLIVETSLPGQLEWPDNCLVQTPTSASCMLSSIQPGETRTIDLPVAAQYQTSSDPVTGQVSPIGVLELQEDNNVATVSLLGGSATENLVLSSSAPASVQSTSASASTTETTPVTGAAQSSSGATWQLEIIVLGILAGWRRRLILRR